MWKLATEIRQIDETDAWDFPQSRQNHFKSETYSGLHAQMVPNQDGERKELEDAELATPQVAHEFMEYYDRI